MPEPSPAADQFPTASVENVVHPARVAGKLASRVWNVTALCFLVALLLIWVALSSEGTKIQIAFGDGSGLEPGDKVRYRGIDVGEVVSVELDDELDHALITAELNDAATPLAREGARFWIERPDIRLGRIRGLETLVGGSYVGVLPGPANSPRARYFEGLSEPPASIEELSDGLEVVLESTQRFGLQRGSPVSYRGVEIGHVISVGLTNDSSTVVARTYIQPEYRSLIRTNTRFWSNSGIDMRIGISGFEFDAETLSTIAAGGVALATPDTLGDRVSAGHRFELAKSPRDEWLRWQPRLPIGSASLPDNFVFPQPTLGVSRQESNIPLLGGTRQRGWLLALDNGSILGPSDLLTASDEKETVLEIWGEDVLLAGQEISSHGHLSSLKLLSEQIKAETLWPISKIEFDADLPKKFPEVVITCGSDNLTAPLSTDRLTAGDIGWQIDPKIPLDETWHGACVVSPTQGNLLGIVLQTEKGMVIEPISRKLVEASRPR